MSLCKYFYFICNLERPGRIIGTIAIIEAKNKSHIYGRHKGVLVFTLSAYYFIPL